MRKFTPGPWYIVCPPWDKTGCVVATDEDPHGAKIICDTGEMAWQDHTQADIREWEANARLIAAAPDLLAACEAFVKWIEYPYMTDEDDSLGEAANRAIYAAIAKAKGKTQ